MNDVVNDDIQSVTINKSFTELLEAFVDEKYICCRIIENSGILVLPCVGISNEVAIFGFCLNGMAEALVVTPSGEAALQ